MDAATEGRTGIMTGSRGRPGKRISAGEIERIVALRQGGKMSERAIARKVGCAQEMVRGFSLRHRR